MRHLAKAILTMPTHYNANASRALGLEYPETREIATCHTIYALLLMSVSRCDREYVSRYDAK